MKYLIVFTLINFSLICKAYACQGMPKGVVKVEMKKDQSICVTIKSEDLGPQSKCFSTADKEYKEIKTQVKGLKAGQSKEIIDENC